MGGTIHDRELAHSRGFQTSEELELSTVWFRPGVTKNCFLDYVNTTQDKVELTITAPKSWNSRGTIVRTHYVVMAGH